MIKLSKTTYIKFILKKIKVTIIFDNDINILPLKSNTNLSYR